MYRTPMHEEIGHFDKHAGDKAEWDFMLRLLGYVMTCYEKDPAANVSIRQRGFVFPCCPGRC